MQMKLCCFSSQLSQLSQFLTERHRTLSAAVPVHQHDWAEGAARYQRTQSRGGLMRILNATGLAVVNLVSPRI